MRWEKWFSSAIPPRLTRLTSYVIHFSPKFVISYEENKCQKRIFWIEATNGPTNGQTPLTLSAKVLSEVFPIFFCAMKWPELNLTGCVPLTTVWLNLCSWPLTMTRHWTKGMRKNNQTFSQSFSVYCCLIRHFHYGQINKLNWKLRTGTFSSLQPTNYMLKTEVGHLSADQELLCKWHHYCCTMEDLTL